MRHSFGVVSWLLALLVVIFSLALGAGLAQDKGSGAGADTDPKPGDEGKPPEVLEREKRISGLFKASVVSFEKDRIILVYNFESKDQDLPEDWLPDLNPKNMRIRWARGIEGTITTVEDGMILGDFGEWYHKASFLGDIDVEVDLLPVSQYKQGNIMGPVFYNEKRKRAIGTNEGNQAVCLANRKHAKPPIPKTEKVVTANERHKIGFAFDGKKLECRYNGRKMTDTSSAPKFTEGFDTGRVGFNWNGSVQYFIFKVTMKGKLDPAWLAKQLGEGVEKKEKKTDPGEKKKGSSAGGEAKKDKASGKANAKDVGAKKASG